MTKDKQIKVTNGALSYDIWSSNLDAWLAKNEGFAIVQDKPKKKATKKKAVKKNG